MSDKTTPKTEPLNGVTWPGEKVHLTVAATHEDARTGALWIHKDLVLQRGDWATEAHVSPMRGTETFGDVASFVEFVSRYGSAHASYLTWNARGLHAVLDYADPLTEQPGRCQWKAEMPFVPSLPWRAWLGFASGTAMNQKVAVERLEDLAGDIVDPALGDLMNLLRSLRATVNAKAEAELRPDGTAKLSFDSETRVQSAKSIDLPSSFAIAIPVLKGHVDDAGRPVAYRLDVRVRVSVGEDARLALRFSIPTAERVLEATYEDRVAAAKALLGGDFRLFRAAD